ncbi:radical SAM protein [Clostridiaceae bacterium M8S5]|nr:radical SAM protein [Clostridiaceae bacterium M8S5]
MKTKIFTIPVTGLDMPHLAVPTLVGFLKNQKYEVSHGDLTGKAINQLLNKKYVKECFEKIDICDEYSSWIKKYGILGYERISEAVSYFRNNKFYDSKQYCVWSSIINIALAVISYKHDSTWSLKNINYNYALENLEDYFKAIEESKCNIFHKVFEGEIKELEKNYVDVVGLSISYDHQLLTALHFAKMIKSRFKKIKVILGGSYLSHLKEVINELLKYENLIDVIILNNGEIPFVAFLESMGKREELEKKCIIEFEYEGKYVIREKNYLVHDYVECFEPDFSEVDFKSYLSSKVTIPIITSYGCYHGKCTFCTHFLSYGGKTLMMDISRLKDLLIKYRDKYKVEVVYFADECISALRLKEISEMIIDNNLDIEWSVETRIDKDFDNESVDKMSNSGCKMLSFGIETVNDTTLNHMNKGFLFSEALDCISKFNNSDIAVAATIMVGYPGESYKGALKTLNGVESKMNLDFFGVSLFGLHKNSILFNQSEKYGIEIIKTKSRMQLNYEFNVKNSKYCREDFKELVDKFYRRDKIGKHFTLISKLLGRTHLIYFDIEEISYYRNRNRHI